MKTKTTVFYDDADTSSFNSVKNYLFETFAEEEGWESEDDILDCVVYHEMEEQQRREWEDYSHIMTISFQKHPKSFSNMVLKCARSMQICIMPVL